MSFSMVNPGGFWFQAQVKMFWRIKAWMRAWMCLRHLTSRLRKITKHKSNLQSSVFCLNQTKTPYSTGNEFSMVNPSGFWFKVQIKMLWRIKVECTYDTWHRASEKSQNTNLIFNRLFFPWIKQKLHIQLETSFSMVNPGRFWFEAQVKMFWRIKAWMRAWMCLRHLTSRLIKITKHKSHLQSCVFCWNRTKITHSTGNYPCYGQPRWILIWSTNKNVMKDKSLNVPTTLHIEPQKNHKTQISSSIVCFLIESNKNYPFNWKWVFL